MKFEQVMILETGPVDCRGWSCANMAEVVRAVFPAVEVRTLRGHDVPRGVARRSPDLVLVRPCAGAASFVRRLRERLPAARILGLLCAERGAEAVETTLRSGVDDFLSCPLDAGELMLRARRLITLERENGRDAPGDGAARASDPRLDLLVGESKAFRGVVAIIREIARSDATVLVTGETGTGKELAARAIHATSARRSRPFVPVNCAALPDQLLENELFGHARGAFTGASSDRGGLVAEAEGGSLFLDEVDALSPSAQAKLLRFLQDGEYRPLGSARSRVGDVRVIAATNRDLWQLVRARGFREDLYFRIGILLLHVPALRERMEDIPLLARHFLARFGARYGREALTLCAGALERLTAYDWPGNVRELEGVIHRAVVHSAGVLAPGDFRLGRAEPPRPTRVRSFSEAKAQAIEHFERTYLTDLLATHDGNISRAARRAGKDRRALQRLLQKHGIDRRAFRG